MEPFARSLGVSAPKGSDVHEVYLKVRSRPSVLGKISNVFGSRGADILGVHAQVSDDKQTGDLILYVEMGGAKGSIKDVVSELKKQDFVIDVRSEDRNRVYFDAFSFPLTSGGHRRVFALDGSGWAALVKSLLQKFGTAGSAILHDEGVSFGRQLADRTSGRFRTPPDRALLVENMRSLFRASGLGVLQVDAKNEGRLRASIADPAVLLGGDDSLTDDFLVGVVRGALEKIYGKEFRVEKPGRKAEAITFELVEGRPGASGPRPGPD